MNQEPLTPDRDDRISVVEINSVLFGVNILRSREVIPLPEVTPVPNTEEFMIGVFNLRGDIYPLIDISSVLGMPLKPVSENDMVIILEGKDLTVGVLTDRIHGVRNLNDVKITPAHGIVSKQMEEFVSGVISEKSSDIYILDIDRLFSSPTLRQYD